MIEKKHDLNRPIRVVVFCGGPLLERGVKRFLCQLEEHPEIEFLGAYCQSKSQTFLASVSDIFRRRGLLAIPLLSIYLGESIGRFLSQPLAEIELRKKIRQLSRRIHFVRDIHSEDVIFKIRSLLPDLGLLYGSPVLRSIIFEIPGLGTLGIHHGKMPEYRGKKTTFWEIFNGEETAGVTIQKINEGLDTGLIVKQGKVQIRSKSPRSVEKELESLGLSLFIEAIVEVKRGKVFYQQWKGKKGKLYRDPSYSDVLSLWWRQTKRRLIGYK